MFGLKNSVLGRTFRTAEITGAYDGMHLPEPKGMASGMISGTQVATNLGWRTIEAIAPGDFAITFDGGMQKVQSISRTVLWSSPNNCPEYLWPLEVPANVLGNKDAIRLLPEQGIMIETDTAEECLGDPFALIPAAALAGYWGITRIKPHGEIVVFTLHFEQEQIVFAHCGVLFLCPSDDSGCLLQSSDMQTPTYCVLPLKQAKWLVESMDTEIYVPAA